MDSFDITKLNQSVQRAFEAAAQVEQQRVTDMNAILRGLKPDPEIYRRIQEAIESIGKQPSPDRPTA